MIVIDIDRFLLKCQHFSIPGKKHLRQKRHDKKALRSIDKCGIHCYTTNITNITDLQVIHVIVISIDFSSDQALYIQLRNQIIYGIATERIKEGDPLPSVRQLADNIGINMHTVNKAYAVLKQEGFIKLDRRKGAYIDLDVNKIRAVEELSKDLKVVLAKAVCKRISKEEVHELVDRILDEYLEEL